VRSSAPQEHGEGDGGLQQGKLVPHAFARTPAKGDECKVGRDLVRVEAAALRIRPVPRPRAVEGCVAVCLRKALRPECVRVLPQVRRSASPVVPFMITCCSCQKGKVQTCCSYRLPQFTPCWSRQIQARTNQLCAQYSVYILPHARQRQSISDHWILVPASLQACHCRRALQQTAPLGSRHEQHGSLA
jgi:hypothetical protein